MAPSNLPISKNEKLSGAEKGVAVPGLTDSKPSVDQISIEAAPNFSHLDEKKILRKMDLRLIPMLALLYLLCFLDRGNIGNAKIEGLQEDLNMTSDQYNWCLTVFFFTYATFEVPSNPLLKKLRPSRWLPTIMVSWGLVMTLMGIVKDYHGLLAARLFLGITEAGLFPGVAYFLTMWYCRHEIQLRQAMFFSAASIAGAFSGLLAFAIAKMDSTASLRGWRWIFILEGILTVVVGFASFWLLYDYPETAGFLSREEKDFVIHRLKYQSKYKGAVRDGDIHVPEAEDFQWAYVWQAFRDWQIYVNIIACWGIICPLYGISFFLPTIIKNLGYTSSRAQLLTIPIYIAASILAVVFAWLSDRVGKRSPFIVGFLVTMAIGFAMCISSPKPGVVYAGGFIATCAMYPAWPGAVAWLANNLSGSYKRGVGMAIQIGTESLGGAMASNFYRQRDTPRYFLGHGLSLGFIGVGIVAALVLMATYSRINKNRERRLAELGTSAFSVQELSFQGDRAITFRYIN